jgi:Domain of unknown function DUF29
MPHDWEQLALYSHYQTAVAMHEDLQAGHMEDALAGLEECIEASSRSDERALKSSLILLMQPIIKWKVQPERRSTRRSVPMEEAWGQIHDLQEENPQFTDERLHTRWPKVLRRALREAEKDMNRKIHHVPLLTRAEVCETPYELDEEQPSVAYELAREQSHGRGSQRPCR